MHHIIAVFAAFLQGFTFQSLVILLSRRSIVWKLVPLAAVLAVPVTSIWEVVRESPDLFVQTLLPWLDILIPMLLGNILGWIMGFRFRRILDEERRQEDLRQIDDHKGDYDKTD